MINRSFIALALEHTLEFLRGRGRYLLPAETVQPFLEKGSALLEKARAPGEVLYVGLLGGTGVGKSTLINALARREISSASDKRPFTDKAVVYRHRETPRGLEEISHLVRDPDATHDSATIKDFVLLDLPDFDSKTQENRRTVLEILPQLDSIVWVTSPEKYADAIFYQSVKETAVSRNNFAFVLNKGDELINNDRHDAHENLKRLTGDLALRLKQGANVDEPRIFCVSAAGELGEGQDPVLASEFGRFRDFLLRSRDAKEISSVKTENLLEQTRRFLADLNAAAHPEEKEALLKSIRESATETKELEARSKTTLPELQADLTHWIMPLLFQGDSSIAPVRWAVKIVTLRRPKEAGAKRALERVFRSAAEAYSRNSRASLEKTAAMLDAEMTLAFPRTKGLVDLKSPEEMLSKATDGAYSLLITDVGDRQKSLKGPVSTLTRLWQRTLMGLPAIVFVLKLAGPDRVNMWFDHPTVEGALKIAITFLTSLFGAEGLIGLAVLTICELLVIWYLASSRNKKLDKLAGNLAASGIAYLEAGLDAAFIRIREERAQVAEQMQNGIDQLKAINAELRSGGRPLAI
jgi:GTP-binding protein EngB required for normal cell division